MPNFNANFSFVPVSRDFMENQMPKANGAYVKVYLTALMLGIDGKNMMLSEIADMLGLLESDVVNALEYWKKNGALDFDGDNVTFDGAEIVKEKVIKTPEPPANATHDIAEEMTENKELADLCEIASEILERPLKKKDMETLYWFVDELSLSPEVITMLLEYCVSKDKRSIGFIEKTAIQWHEKGVTTLSAADKFIRDQKEMSTYIGIMKKLFNFGDRNLTKSEEESLSKWRDEYGMDENMVALAYEYCLDAIHVLSFPYMDKILGRWKELGITTTEAAEKDHDDYKGGKKNVGTFGDNDMSYDEIKKLIREKM